MNIYEKLMRARMEFQALPLKGSGENTFAKYTYLELGDILPNGIPIMHKNGLGYKITFPDDRAEMLIVEYDGEGSILIEIPRGSANLKGCHDVQNIGATVTYQRRYLWMTALDISESDGLEASSNGPNVIQKEPTELPDNVTDLIAQVNEAASLADVTSLWEKQGLKFEGGEYQKKIRDAFNSKKRKLSNE